VWDRVLPGPTLLVSIDQIEDSLGNRTPYSYRRLFVALLPWTNVIWGME
jgi:hypothetical protein